MVKKLFQWFKCSSLFYFCENVNVYYTGEGYHSFIIFKLITMSSCACLGAYTVFCTKPKSVTLKMSAFPDTSIYSPRF